MSQQDGRDMRFGSIKDKDSYVKESELLRYNITFFKVGGTTDEL